MYRFARLVVALVGLLTLHAGATVNAETLSKFYVPFDFTAGETTLPAGAYVVRRAGASLGVLEVEGAKQRVVLTSYEGMSGDSADAARLVFNRYGDRYFLREVWLSGSSGYPIQETTEERQQGEDKARRVRLIILSGGER
jgi:hypothetical protein